MVWSSQVDHHKLVRFNPSQHVWGPPQQGPRLFWLNIKNGEPVKITDDGGAEGTVSFRYPSTWEPVFAHDMGS